ncbi:MAG: SH3 domain-containing protein, partial [Planctomycetota bacterium]|nr:SH3 domain-containing protein [Planctomycetota bacterium]
MRKLFLIVILFFMVVGLRPPLAGDAFNFSDLPPLPPPLLDEGPNPPPLTPPQAGSLSPLAQPSTMPPALPPASPAVSAPAIVQPSLPPAVPPLNPPQSAIPDVTPVNMPDALRPPEQPVAVIPSIPETPRPGKVVGGRVNVRAGPNTQYESIAVLTTGSPVTVLAKNGEWYKIVFPAEQLASIHKNYVDAELSGEIPETG